MDVPGDLDIQLIKCQTAVDADVVVNNNSAGAGSYRQGTVAVGGVVEDFVKCDVAVIRRHGHIGSQGNRRFVNRDFGVGISRLDVGAEADRTRCRVIEVHGAG